MCRLDRISPFTGVASSADVVRVCSRYSGRVTIDRSAPLSSAGGCVMLLVRMLFLATLLLVVVVARVAGQEPDEALAKAAARAAIVKRIDELVNARLKAAG